MEATRGEPISIIDRLRQLDPKRHPAFAAVDHLTDPDERKQFMVEYADLLSNSDNPRTREDPDAAAIRSMRTIARLFYPGEAMQDWIDEFPEIGDPMRDVDPQTSFRIGEATAEAQVADVLQHKA